MNTTQQTRRATKGPHRVENKKRATKGQRALIKRFVAVLPREANPAEGEVTGSGEDRVPVSPRRHGCEHTNACLDLACAGNWDALSCGECGLFGAPVDRDADLVELATLGNSIAALVAEEGDVTRTGATALVKELRKKYPSPRRGINFQRPRVALQNTEYLTGKEVRGITEHKLLQLLANGPQHEIALSRVVGYESSDPEHARKQLRKMLGRIARVDKKLTPSLWQWRAK